MNQFRRFKFLTENVVATVYHGTPHKFTEFKKATGVNSTIFGSEPVERHGFFFTPNHDVAKDYAGESGNVVHAKLNMKNPFDMRTGVSEKMEQDFDNAGGNPSTLYNHMEPWERLDGEYGEHFTNILKKAGYDGMIFHEHSPHDGKKHESHVVFHPSQIEIKKVI